MDLVRERYADFGPTLACEKLAERHGRQLSAEMLRGWLIGDGLREAKWPPADAAAVPALGLRSLRSLRPSAGTAEPRHRAAPFKCRFHAPGVKPGRLRDEYQAHPQRGHFYFGETGTSPNCFDKTLAGRSSVERFRLG